MGCMAEERILAMLETRPNGNLHVNFNEFLSKRLALISAFHLFYGYSMRIRVYRLIFGGQLG